LVKVTLRPAMLVNVFEACLHAQARALVAEPDDGVLRRGQRVAVVQRGLQGAGRDRARIQRHGIGRARCADEVSRSCERRSRSRPRR
jgi:hypothetical protein